MNEVVLTHFSAEPFSVDLNMDYRIGEVVCRTGKPHGLWLSDDTDYGWAQWCTDNGFMLDHLTCRADFAVDLTDCLVLDTTSKIETLFDIYPNGRTPDDWRMDIIDWHGLSRDYKGIFISPYSYTARLQSMWYYGWDCASGCFWDLSVIKK